MHRFYFHASMTRYLNNFSPTLVKIPLSYTSDAWGILNIIVAMIFFSRPVRIFISGNCGLQKWPSAKPMSRHSYADAIPSTCHVRVTTSQVLMYTSLSVIQHIHQTKIYFVRHLLVPILIYRNIIIHNDVATFGH